MGLAYWSPLWHWPWWRWASQPCSTWCLALYSPAWRWHSGARSCPSSGLGLDLWWIPVWYECPLRIIPLPPSKKKTVPQKSPTGHRSIYIMRNEVEIQVEWQLGCIFVFNDFTVPTDALCNPCPKPTPLPLSLLFRLLQSGAADAPVYECHCRYPIWACLWIFFLSPQLKVILSPRSLPSFPWVLPCWTIHYLRCEPLEANGVFQMPRTPAFRVALARDVTSCL